MVGEFHLGKLVYILGVGVSDPMCGVEGSDILPVKFILGGVSWG